MYKVYRLICPVVNDIVYVGMTKNDLKTRLGSHKSFIIGSEDKWYWNEELKQQGLAPKIELICEYESKESAMMFENYWIHFYSRTGKDLLNKMYNKNLDNHIIPYDKLHKLKAYTY